MSVDVVAPIIEPDGEAMRSHLNALFVPCRDGYEEGLIEIAYGDKKPDRAAYFSNDDSGIERAIEAAMIYNRQGQNVYVGVNPRKHATNTKKRASDDDVEISYFVFADIDDAQSSLMALRSGGLAIAPTMMVMTGTIPHRRPHIYWELEEPTVNMAAWRALQLNIAMAVGGDHVINPSRIMRLAGTVNYPSPDKNKRGYRTETVRIKTEFEDERAPVSHEAVHAAFPVVRIKDTHTDIKYEGKGKTGRLLQEALAGNNWHNNVLKVTASWARKGLSTDEIMLLSAGITRPGYTVDETQRDILQMTLSAREKFNIPEPKDESDEESSGSVLSLISPSAWDGIAPPEREWRWDNFIPNHQATLLTGAGATGKSLLSQQMATCVGLGMPVLGVPTKAVPSLYITCEDDPDELHRRQAAICATLGIPLPETHGRVFLLSLYGELGNELCTFTEKDTISVTERYASIVATCQQIGIKHIVLDNTAHLFTGDENKRSHVTAFLNLCNRMAREIEGSVMIVGHPNKAGDSYSGSTAWENNVRSRIFMSRVLDEAGEAKDPDLRVIRNEKANYSRQGNQLEFRWHKGAFSLATDLSESDRDQIAETILANAENDTFLNCLDILTEQKRKVSASTNGSYAPRVMSKMTEGKGFKVKQFEAAMERLFSLGIISAEVDLWKGSDRKMVTGLGRCEVIYDEN